MADTPLVLDELAVAYGVLADVLAVRLERISGAGGSPWRVHVDGPWGSGKSSLLHLLAARLQDGGQLDRPWLVVHFNAWTQQRIIPRWWSLLDTIHRQAVRELRSRAPARALLLAVWRVWWRLREGRGAYVLVPLAAVAAFLLWQRGVFGGGAVGAAELAKALTAVAVFLAAGWGLVRKLNKWLVSISVGAEIQLERTQGVSAAAGRRYRRLVRLIGRPFAVLIDDLDRTDPSFAVELLEGIEQLWGDVPVVYLTAVDGSVLRDAFLEAELARPGNAPGDTARSAAWLRYQRSFDDVIRLRALDHRALAAELRPRGHLDEAALAAHFEPLDSIEALLAALAEAHAAGVASHLALCRAALLRLETPELQRSLEHWSARFLPYLDPSAHAGYRFTSRVSTALYGLMLGGNALTEPGHVLEQIAVWTIVRLRSPLIAELLEQNPEGAERARELARRASESEEPPLDLARLEQLLSQASTRALLRGDTELPALDADTVTVLSSVA